LLVSLLYFSRYAYHRDLHSFPTRRSSDLRDERKQSLLFFILHPSSLIPSERRHVTGTSVATARGAPAALARSSRSRVCLRRRSRSEEHTSELQSRFDLVCRLLLEKKKNTK